MGLEPELDERVLQIRILQRGKDILKQFEDQKLRDYAADELRERGVVDLLPPTWRRDLRDPYDYVEEVGAKWGVDRIEPVGPITSRPSRRRTFSSQRGSGCSRWPPRPKPSRRCS